MSIGQWWRTRSVVRGTSLLTALTVLGLLTLAGCGSGASSSTPMSSKASACSGCGTAMISLSDAPGDFVSYIVKIDALTLTRSDGTTVQTLPVATQVDLAQLVNLSEIVSARQIPAGTYDSATLTLDYTNATLVVETASGNVTVPAADILDGKTNAPVSGQITVTLSLNSDDDLVITQGTVSNLALDFNLSASNTVDLTANPLTVTVNPILTASLAPASTKQIHVRGPLVSVSTTNDNYVIDVRPFDDSDNDFGQFTVQTTSSTTFLINGTSYTGSAGLAQLATLPAQTLTEAYGSWDRTTKTFTASSVQAGSSVAGASGPSVAGTVVARSGNTLTLANGLVFQPQTDSMDDDFQFHRQMTVTLDSGTTVTEQGQSGSFDISDISVGQHARFFGTLTSGSSGATLDATAGSVLLLPTSGFGLVSTTATGSVTVSLQSLGHVLAGNLDFTGTGMSAAQDASASAYQITVPNTFSMSSITTGLPVSFSGFVAPFGAAPPDFSASTLVSYGQSTAELRVSWPAPGITKPFTMLTASELLLSQATLQQASSGQIRIDWSSLDPSTLASGLELLPDTSNSEDSAEQSFAIAHAVSEKIDTFATFSDFTTALTTDLNGTTTVLRVAAEGTYGSGGALTADHVIVVLDD